MEAEALQRLSNRAGTQVVQGTIDAGPVRTSYLAAGQGDPILLIHGAGASGLTWYPVFGALAPRFWVIAPDVVGHGESERPRAAYDRAYYSAWLKDLAAALGLQKAAVVGHSLGGAIALQYTLDFPDLVDRLVLVSPLGLGRGKPAVSPGFAVAMVWLMLFPSPAGGRWLLRRYAVYNPRNAERIIGELEDFGSRRARRRALPRGGARVAVSIPGHELARIQQPTLVIWGEQDSILPLAAAREGLKALPNARLVVIPRTGHMSPHEEPEVFNRALLGFLTGRAAQTEADEEC